MSANEKSGPDERLDRFKRLGGVDLARLAPEERQAKESSIIVGIEPFKRAVFTFRCPICGNVARNDCEMEPACTGPTWLDEHPLEPMERIPG